MAQKYGRKLNVPVLYVNHSEAHILTSRFEQVDKAQASVPLLEFPYLSVLCTGRQTEIVLSTGVGHHTIMGTTIDIGVGNALDKVASLIIEHLIIL
jgi:N6-L-threonylcarbamoyladenine synthase